MTRRADADTQRRAGQAIMLAYCRYQQLRELAAMVDKWDRPRLAEHARGNVLAVRDEIEVLHWVKTGRYTE